MTKPRPAWRLYRGDVFSNQEEDAVTQRTGAPPDQTTPDDPRPLDWSRAKIGDPAPCTVCRRPALLRHPETGQPHHKVCAEPVSDTAPVPVQSTAVIPPCRFCGNPASLRGPEGKPEHWSCRAAQSAGPRLTGSVG